MACKRGQEFVAKKVAKNLLLIYIVPVGQRGSSFLRRSGLCRTEDVLRGKELAAEEKGRRRRGGPREAV